MRLPERDHVCTVYNYTFNHRVAVQSQKVAEAAETGDISVIVSNNNFKAI